MLFQVHHEITAKVHELLLELGGWDLHHRDVILIIPYFICIIQMQTCITEGLLL